MTHLPVIGVAGLGTMGLGIAQVFAQAGHTVLATDTHRPAREGARDRMAAALDLRVATGKLRAADRADSLARLNVVDSVTDLHPCTLVIEAVAEDRAVKSALFASLEGSVAPDAVLASNTSSLSIASLGEPLRHPGRLLGLHFFNPAPAMRLVELIGSTATDPAALALARGVTEGAGKTVVLSPDRPGFIVNRCARPFYGEALALLEDGRTASDIDAAMLACGYRIGPFALIDLIGADVHLAATEGIAAAMGDHPRYHVFDALRRAVAAGALGRKAGRGFLFPAAPGPAPADAAEICLRIEATLVNEAAHLLAEGGTTAGDIDRAMMLALNFPRGPSAMLRAQGAGQIAAVLARCAAAAPRQLAGRYLAAPGIGGVA